MSIDTTKDLTPVLQIATWFLQCITVLVFLVRMGIKLKIIRDFTQDDIAILVASVRTASRPVDPLTNDSQVFSTGQCVAASLQNANGFGQHRAALDEGHIQAALKVIFLIKSAFGATLTASGRNMPLNFYTFPAYFVRKSQSLLSFKILHPTSLTAG